MTDKKPSSEADDEAPEKNHGSISKREGNPWQRQRYFSSQRRAVLRPRDGEGKPPAGGQPDDTGGGGVSAGPDDPPVDMKARMKEYRGRQRRTPRPESDSDRASRSGRPDDDES